MLIKYNHPLKLMYIHLVTGTPNLQIRTPKKDIYKFVKKSNRKETIGYEIENAEKNIMHVLQKLSLDRKQKLAVIMCFIREKRKKTQKEFSTILNVSESTYKSIERAEHNITFDTLDLIYDQFEDENVLQTVFS